MRDSWIPPRHEKTMRRSLLPTIGIALALLYGCGGGPAGFGPLDTANTLFWDRQTVESGQLLRAMIDEFNAGHTGPPIKIEYAGSHAEIYRKTSASIQARRLPAMAVCYGSMAVEYARAGAIVPLDPLLNEPSSGLTPDEWDDFFPVVRSTGTFPELGGKIYTFPFAKSALMLFYNTKVLAEAGIADPPATWDEFLGQCRQIKEKTGKVPYPAAVDCSTIDALIFSMGGEILQGRETLFDAPEAVRVFELLETLVREGLTYQIAPGTFDDNVALANDRAAFTLRTSASFAAIAQYRGGDKTGWGATRVPQADPNRPATLLFGPNVCVFQVPVEQQRAAWAFLKYFASPENTARWAVSTGYLPVRKSAANAPALQAHWKEWPGSRAAFDGLAFARSEPDVAGWQEVRSLVEKAETEVITGMKSGRQAATGLKKAADAVLARP